MHASPRHDLRRQREAMVDQLLTRSIEDQAVIRAMRAVPRHLFLPDEALHAQAYNDCPLPIGHGQTISQPYVVAVMSQWLEARPGMSVLEIGTGSGYQAAILAAMGLDVFTVERVRDLYFHACDVFRHLRLRRIRTRLDDGTQGWPDAAPFDRILVAAGGPDVPPPLVAQLADPGMLIMPRGGRSGQKLVRAVKQDGVVRIEDSDFGVVFVDLIGTHGWNG